MLFSAEFKDANLESAPHSSEVTLLVLCFFSEKSPFSRKKTVPFLWKKCLYSGKRVPCCEKGTNKKKLFWKTRPSTRKEPPPSQSYPIYKKNYFQQKCCSAKSEVLKKLPLL
jgi:hypothetical protein